MKKIYLVSMLCGGALMTASNASAIDSTGGCGLGSMAWKGQSGIAPQVLAMTTNGTFMNTIGVTFGTSGCDPDGRVTGGTGKMMLAFLENNMEQYAMDAAAGQGETIETLAGIMNVDSKKLGEISKNNFAEIFPDENADAVHVTLALMDAVNKA